MSRDQLARWLIEKLLASFVISVIIIYGPIIGFNIQKSGLGTTYSVVTSVTLLISIVANILIPQDFGFSRRLDALKGKNQESEAE
jgi:uncharacterized membrane protein